MAVRQMLGSAFLIFLILLSSPTFASRLAKSSKGPPPVTYQHSVISENPGSGRFSPSPTNIALPSEAFLKIPEERGDYRPALGGIRLPLEYVKPIHSDLAQTFTAAVAITKFPGLRGVSSPKAAFAAAVPSSTGHSVYTSILADGGFTLSHVTVLTNGSRTGTLTRLPSSSFGSNVKHFTASSGDPSYFSSIPLDSVKRTTNLYFTHPGTTFNATNSSDGNFLQGSEIDILSFSRLSFPTAGGYNKSNYQGLLRNSDWRSAASGRPSAFMNTMLKGFRPNNGETYRQSFAPSGSAVSNCSGVVTIYPATSTKIVTATVLVNETMILPHNATIPAPVFITPLSACQTITSRCAAFYHGRCPNNNPIIPGFEPKIIPAHVPSTTSTLLVTKKSPAIIHQGQAVGNIFGPTTTAKAVIAPSPANGQPAGSPQIPQTSSSGSSGGDIQVQSDGSSTSKSSNDDQLPGSITPQQEPHVGDLPAAVPEGDNTGSQQMGDDSNHGQASGGQSLGAQFSGTQDSAGQVEGNHSNEGIVSESTGPLVQLSPSHNSSIQTTEDSVDSDQREDPPAPGSAQNPSGDTSATSQNGDSGVSGSNVGSQGSTNVVHVNGIPIAILPSAVIVGSQTIKPGQLPTTVVVQAQTIAVQPSRIVAAGTTFPIEAVVRPPPVISVKVGNTPVVLQPGRIMIGPQIFSHGSSAGTALLNGQTYSWDAVQLVGPSTTLAFPSVTPLPVPLITAAGQVFSVYPSSLKAAGLTLPIPGTPKASPFVYNRQTFLINPSQLIAPERSITISSPGKPTPFVYDGDTFSVDASQLIGAATTMSLSAGSGLLTYEGQGFTIRPSQIAGPSTTIALSDVPEAGVAVKPSAMTAGGLIFSLGPSAAVIGSSTYSFVPGQVPSTIISHGQTILLGSQGLHIGNTRVPRPTISSNYSVVTQGILTLSLAPSKVILGGHTDDIQSEMLPIRTVVDGQTIIIGPHGVDFGTTTIPLPTPKPSYQVVIEGDLTFSVASSEAVIKGSTFAIGPDVPATMVMEGQRFEIGPTGIHFSGTTIDLPTVTAEGLMFPVGSMNAVCCSSVYLIRNGAMATNVAVGSQMIELGTNRIVLTSTTISPWSNTTTPSLVSVSGTNGALGFSPPTGLSGSGSSKAETGLHNRAGNLLRPSLSLFSITLVGASVLMFLFF